MNPLIVGCIGTAGILTFMFLGITVGPAMMFVALLGTLYLSNWAGMFHLVSTVPFNITIAEGFVCLPLFLLMAEVVYRTGLSSDMFTAIERWMGQLKGGLAMASISACAVFSAVSAHSVAVAVTIGTAALPEMRKRNYAPSLATGCLAAGGCLGPIIPPSGVLIIYGTLTQTSIGSLFIAGLFPGIIIALLWLLLITIRTRINPKIAPPGPSVPLKEKVTSLWSSVPVILLLMFVLGGLIVGWFTATEAGGIGSFGAFVIALAFRKLTWKTLREALFHGMQTTAMIYLLLMSAMLFAPFITLSGVPAWLARTSAGLPLPPLGIMGAIIFVYFLLGFIMPSSTLMVITIPILLPIFINFNFDLVWVGILMVLCVEMGAITPPVAINVWAIHGIAPDIPMETVCRGIFPFLFILMGFTILLLFAPQIALWLPYLGR